MTTIAANEMITRNCDIDTKSIFVVDDESGTDNYERYYNNAIQVMHKSCDFLTHTGEEYTVQKKMC